MYAPAENIYTFFLQIVDKWQILGKVGLSSLSAGLLNGLCKHHRTTTETMNTLKTMKPYSPTRGGIVTTALGVLLTQLPLLAAQQELATFKTADSLESWTSVNDGVMGGVSKGGFKRTEQGTLLFSGELSLKNNGGFASVRTKSREFDLSGTSAIVVKARGDGRTYWLDLRTAGQMGATSYRAYLPTKAGEWQETRIPFADFKPQAFGRALPFKAINPAEVASLGFTLADKTAGSFSLEIESVTATDEQAAPPAAAVTKKGKTLVDLATAAGGFKTLLAAAAAADLVGVLSGKGPLTVLAPTDEAFAKLPAGTVDHLLKPENRGQLVAILKNHVIAGQVNLAKALELGEGTTLQGSKVAVRFEEGRVRIGSATLVTADLQASNGIIHVIDQVLIPATPEAVAPSPTGLIELAISRGVPLFNKGDVAACAALYEVTCEALQIIDGVTEKSRAELAQVLKKARAESSARERAWILRDGMDRAWTSLKKQ